MARRVIVMFFGCYGLPPFLCLLKHLSEIQKIKSNYFWFCSILLKLKHDEAGLIRNRFFSCRYVVAVNAKVIFRFEAKVLKGIYGIRGFLCDIVM